jgi:glycerol-3-phosphate dehydrogenase
MGARTCIGTTDTPVERPEVEVTAEDRRFVLDNINKRLRLTRPLDQSDIVAERCGVRPLAVEAGGDGVPDWMQLSRRHFIEVDGPSCRITIFGGKLTDCVNVGERISAEASRLGVALPSPDRVWYGEPPAVLRDEFFHQARLMGLDGDAAAGTPGERASARLWRRYGAEALSMLETIRRDPRAVEPLLAGSEVLRCEVEEAASREMVVTLEDFLRRRTSIAQLVRLEELRASPGLREASRILFGAAADDRLEEYFARRSPARAG